MFAEADLAQPVVQVVEHGSRQDKAGVGVLLGQAVFQLLVEEARHAVAEIAVQGAGDGRQRDAFGLFEVQAAHERAQAFREGHPVERGKGAQAVVAGVECQQPVPAGGLKQEVAGQNAVASPPPVDLRAFQQNVHIRREPPRALAQGDVGGGGRFGSCHVGDPFGVGVQKKAPSLGGWRLYERIQQCRIGPYTGRTPPLTSMTRHHQR